MRKSKNKYAKYTTLPSKEIIKKTILALKNNGFEAYFVNSGAEAKSKVLDQLPPGKEVMDMTSITLETINLAKEIEESGKFNSVRKRLYNMDRNTQELEMLKLGAAPEYVIGSVHAITQDGKVMVASQSGSQLPSYAYGSSKVIWVVGVQKIVKNIDEGFKRIYKHSLPLESVRAKKAYGVPGSAVNKVLIVNKEVKPRRIAIILVNEALGF